MIQNITSDQSKFDVSISDLPYSLLVKILSYLTTDDRLLDACLVCKSWHSACFDEIFWKKVYLRDRRLITDEVLKRLVSYGKNVTHLDIADCFSQNVTSEGLVEATGLCPNLKSLIIRNGLAVDVGDETVIQICQSCPKLEVFYLYSQGLTNKALTEGLSKLKFLQFLNIEQNSSITDDGLIPFIQNSPNLSTLRLTLLSRVTNSFVDALAEREKKNPRMEDLSVSMTAVTGLGCQSLRFLTNVTVLELSRCKGLNHVDLEVILPHTTKIKEIYMSIIDTVDDKCIKIIATYLKDLVHIDMASTSVTDTALEYLSSETKKLNRIDMAYTKVTHQGVEMICENIPSLQHLGLLRCDSADDNELEKIVQRFPYIYFSTFFQDFRRMLVRSGRWDKDDTGIVTSDMIKERLALPIPDDVYTKPRRLIGTGGKVKYVPYEMPFKSGSAVSIKY